MWYWITVAAQRFFDQARLRVGAIEHGAARQILLLAGFADVFLNAVGDEERFVFTVGSFVIADERLPPSRAVHRFLPLRWVFCATTAEAPSRMVCVER